MIVYQDRLGTNLPRENSKRIDFTQEETLMGSVGKRNSVVMAELDDEVCRLSHQLLHHAAPHCTALHSAFVFRTAACSP